ncbi:hypothetical protein V501_05578 [Pseudogymnoascus sp. VKM F-4519 (FW-2642)]|nr:hypothetical protein V501_05578 [Pseudogymnoascus sp. VKM F-4519 (FW-2642)]
MALLTTAYALATDIRAGISHLETLYGARGEVVLVGHSAGGGLVQIYDVARVCGSTAGAAGVWYEAVCVGGGAGSVNEDGVNGEDDGGVCWGAETDREGWTSSDRDSGYRPPANSTEHGKLTEKQYTPFLLYYPPRTPFDHLSIASIRITEQPLYPETMAASKFTVRAPCSSANIGPGFDVIGLALSMYLELKVTVDPSETTSLPLNCRITYEGEGAPDVPLDPEVNLITKVALYVLRCHGQRVFPKNTHVHVINPIPLGRGLGSSGSAVVSGVVLANEAGKLGLSKARILDYCLMVERHPDNIAATLYGGFVGTYLNELKPADVARLEIPVSEVLSNTGGVDTGLNPPEPPFNIGHFHKFKWAPEIRCIVVIPDFEVATAKAREVLPTSYTRPDIVFNLQRVALLPTALGESPPDPEFIYLSMQDKIHQPYRKTLIPGLTEILSSISPKSHPGLLGTCLSGAGPTIMTLATDNFESIANHLISEFKKEGITCAWKLLDPAQEGTTVTYDA